MNSSTHLRQLVVAGLVLAAMTLMMLEALTRADDPGAAPWVPLAGGIVVLWTFALAWFVMVAVFVAAAVARQLPVAIQTAWTLHRARLSARRRRPMAAMRPSPSLADRYRPAAAPAEQDRPFADCLDEQPADTGTAAATAWPCPTATEDEAEDLYARSAA